MIELKTLDQSLNAYEQLKAEIIGRAELLQQDNFLLTDLRVELQQTQVEYKQQKDQLRDITFDESAIDRLVERLVQQRKESYLQLENHLKHYATLFLNINARNENDPIQETDFANMSSDSFYSHDQLISDCSFSKNMPDSMSPLRIAMSRLVCLKRTQWLNFANEWLDELKNDESVSHRLGRPFFLSIDSLAMQYRDYLTVIQQPIDVPMIIARVKNSQLKEKKRDPTILSYSTFLDFLHDVQRLFSNCYLYNGLDDLTKESHRVLWRDALNMTTTGSNNTELAMLAKKAHLSTVSSWSISTQAYVLEYLFCQRLSGFLKGKEENACLSEDSFSDTEKPKRGRPRKDDPIQTASIESTSHILPRRRDYERSVKCPSENSTNKASSVLSSELNLQKKRGRPLKDLQTDGSKEHGYPTTK